MSAVLKNALDDYYKTIKGERANYQACYKSFLEYCNQELKLYSLADLSANLTKIDVEQACKYYFETNKRATSIEAIQRFLTAIDQFSSYAKERDIEWRYLKEGCRNKQIVHDIWDDLIKYCGMHKYPDRIYFVIHSSLPKPTTYYYTVL